MDVLSHAVLPLAAYALLLRRPTAERLAAGLGAAAPDLDALFTWVARIADPLYAFTHRGWTHTLWGAPLVGVALLALVTHPAAARRWPRLRAFAWSRPTILAAVAGALSHLVLDALTITGVPALWPLSLQRFTPNLFFFAVPYMALPSAYAVWRLYKGSLNDRLLGRVALVLVVMMVASGSLRAATRPAEGPDAVVVPAPLDGRWLVAEPLPGGWVVQERGLGGDGRALAFTGNSSPLADDAVRAAQRLGAYTAWAWDAPAPLVNTTPIDHGWRVAFRDATGLYRNATSALGGGLFGEADALVVEVVRGEARVVERPGGYGLG